MKRAPHDEAGSNLEVYRLDCAESLIQAVLKPRGSEMTEAWESVLHPADLNAKSPMPSRQDAKETVCFR